MEFCFLLVYCCKFLGAAIVLMVLRKFISWDLSFYLRSQPDSGRRLDKTKFFLVGAGLFSGVSGLLYPISVIKTRMQVARADTVHTTAPALFKHILRSEGVLGLYRGFGLVISGAIPSRVVFMTALETTKASTLKVTEKLDVSEATAAAMANGLAGLCSSLASQSVFVPIDVVSLLICQFFDIASFKSLVNSFSAPSSAWGRG